MANCVTGPLAFALISEKDLPTNLKPVVGVLVAVVVTAPAGKTIVKPLAGSKKVAALDGERAIGDADSGT